MARFNNPECPEVDLGHLPPKRAAKKDIRAAVDELNKFRCIHYSAAVLLLRHIVALDAELAASLPKQANLWDELNP